MCDYEKRDSNAISMNLPHCVLCIIHFFLLHEISPRAEKICYSRVRNDNSMMPFVTRACFFWARAQKICILTLILTFVPLTLIFVPHACFFVHGAHLSKTDEETLAKKGFFACFFLLVRKKICIFIWSIRPVHAMLRTCKKWHHVHAMLCTRFCIKKKWTSHSSQIIIVSEQGKTIIRREENERGIIHDIKKQYVFRHHPDCIFYIYVKGWQDDTAKD